MRKLVSAAAAARLLAAGLAAGLTTGGGATAAAPARQAHQAHRGYTPPAIHWTTCSWDQDTQCGMLTVPLDYAKPDGRTIKLAVSRVAHTTSRAKYQGVMLVNPGGPGASGLTLSHLGSAVPRQGGAPYDWIGFDPRGVGSSTPSLSCDGDYFAAGRPAYVPATPQVEDYWQDQAVGYSVDCRKANLPLLRHTDTRTWVQDLESLRRALHRKKINYYGFSYGTYLGQVYATLHPDRVRRFVFDGVVNPKDVWYDANLEQDKQFDTNIDTFFDWVADHDDVYGLGTDGAAVRQVYYDKLQHLTDHPQAHFGAADWTDVFVSAAYYVYGWDYFADVLVAAHDGNLKPAKDAYGDPTGPGADNTYANYLAVECADAAWPQAWSTWQQDNDALYAEHPFLTWNNAWYNAPCRTWSAPSGKPVNVSGAKSQPVLLIEETDDAATPWAGALEVRKRFPGSVLIEGVGGTTHAGSLSGVSCVDNRIAAYLKTGALPDRTPGQGHSDVQCEPVPPPEATAGRERARPAPHDELARMREQLARLR